MAVGRPPRYKSAKEMQIKIDAYFADCEGVLAEDKDGNVIFNKYGLPCYLKPPKPPTVTGLALALGFNTRLALLNYQGKPEFVNTITRAKTYIERYAEERLYDRDGVNGAKFNLANNFRGWNASSQRVEADDGVEVINDAPEETNQDIGDHHSEVPADI